MAHQNSLSLLSLVFLLYLISFCSPSSGSLSTVAVSQTPDDTVACALVRNSSNATPAHDIFCYSSRQDRRFSLPTNVGFRAVAAGGGFVCGVSSSDSALLCWDLRNTSRPRRVARALPAVSDLQVGHAGQVCALDSAENLSCWRWRGFDLPALSPRLSSIAVGGQFLCGQSNGSNEVDCYVPGLGWGSRSARFGPRPMLLVAAGIQHACGLIESTGKVECWGMASSGTEYKVPDHSAFEFNQLALGNDWSCALRAGNKTVACWTANGSELPTPLDQVELLHLSAKGRELCGVVYGNYSLICWDALAKRQTYLALDEVLPGPCVSTCQSKLPGSGNLCPSGLFICAPDDFRPNTWTPPPPNIVNPPPPSPPAPRISRRTLALLIVGCVGTAIGVASLACFVARRFCGGMNCRVHDSGPIEQMPPAPGSHPSQPSPPKSRAPPQLGRLVSLGVGAKLEEFPLELLLKVTNNFCASCRTGGGSFGSVYEAYLPDGRHVAIKRAEAPSPSAVYVKHYHQDNEHAFEAELAFLSRLNHKNLVQLIGFCEEETAEFERLLVYEFMTNGSLHDHLHKKEESRLHDWVARIRVALDAARGIEYLHTYAVPPIIHRDIKSANILLDATYTAKVADFGLSLMGPNDESGHLSLRAAGTVGYMDPEYYRLQQLTTKSDVYSFGVVLLELLTGYKAIHKERDGSSPRNVVDFAVPFIVSDEIHQVLDRRLSPPTPYEIEAVTYVGYLAADCVSLEGKDRPSMTEVVSSLERALAASMRTPSGSRSQSFD